MSIVLSIFNLIYSHLKKQVAPDIYQITSEIKLKIRPHSTDLFVIFETYDLKEYKDNFSKKDIVVDIGAHLGAFSTYASRKVKQVISYEPSPQNYALLSENKKINKLTNIKLNQIAVSGNKGKIKLSLDPGNFGGNSIYGSQKSIQVNTIPLTQVIKDNHLSHIDFLKIDTEGAEYDILLKTPKKYLDVIKKIHLEYHDNLPHNHNFKQLVVFLENNGFTVYSRPFLPLNLSKTGLIEAYR